MSLAAMGSVKRRITGLLIAAALVGHAGIVAGQVAPSRAEVAAYRGLHAAAAAGDLVRLNALLAAGQRPDVRDGHGRTPMHVAAHARAGQLFAPLVARGADPNALDADRYDIVTIASVADDMDTLVAALKAGCKAGNVTSPYDGTALIAAAHLGHAEVVRTLLAAGAPPDHVNNLGWTALIESIVLGDGGARHLATLKALVQAGADVNLADRGGRTPLSLAKDRGYTAMVQELERAGAR